MRTGAHSRPRCWPWRWQPRRRLRRRRRQRARGRPSSDGSTGGTTGTGPTGRPVTLGGATPVALDPAHAVDPPGRRTGLIAPADIVANGSKTIPDDKVAAIRALDGVVGVEQIALATVPIENRALHVAAVDPGSYRNRVIDSTAPRPRRSGTGSPAASWRPAVAEEARTDHRRRLPGAGQHRGRRGGPRRRVRPAVVAGRRGRQRHVDPDPGHDAGQRPADPHRGTAPERLRKPIQRILQGTEASVQMTDVVAREGLDPGRADRGRRRHDLRRGGDLPLHRPRRWPHRAGPAWEAAHIATEPVPILGNVTCNKLIFPSCAPRSRTIAQGLPARSTRGVRRVLLPTLHRRHHHPVQPRVRASPSTSTCRATSAAPPARWTAASSRSSSTGASPGRGLAVHRPDALRDEPPRATAVRAERLPVACGVVSGRYRHGSEAGAAGSAGAASRRRSAGGHHDRGDGCSDVMTSQVFQRADREPGASARPSGAAR